MPQFLVDIQSTASAVVTVDISDETLQELADNLGVEVKDLTADDLHDLMYENMDTPTICAQCSGWGNEKVSLSLGDEWEICDDSNVTEPKYKSVRRKED